jgi:hypothetical protein
MSLFTLCAVAVTPLAAQSVVVGAISGLVTDSAGNPLRDADVTLSERLTGLARGAVTSRVGRFSFRLIPPGSYDLYVERVGYRPQRVRGVDLGPAAQLDIAITLTSVVPPVTTIDTTVLDPRFTRRPAFRWTPREDLAEVADPLARAEGAALLFSPAADGLAFGGLPDGRLLIDGVPFSAVRHAGDPAPVSALALPLDAAARTWLQTVPVDVQWPGLGGGALNGQTRGGARYHGATLTAGAGSGFRGQVMAWGPIVRDTASFLIGGSFERLEPMRPAPWALDSVTAALDTIARDSLGRDLGAQLRDYAPRSELATAFGRFDIQVAPNHRVEVRASAGRLSASDGPLAAPALGARLVARDAVLAGVLTSAFGAMLGSELRASLDYSDRRYRGDTASPHTVFVAAPLSAGAAGTYPADLKRTTIRGGAVLHVALGDHRLKGGLELRFDAHDRTWAAGRLGSFVFDDTAAFRQRRGVFTGYTGTAPVAAFDSREIALFVQDMWLPAPGLEITFGIRTSRERLPGDAIRLNNAWRSATGLDNSVLPRATRRTDPRFAFRWAIGASRSWTLEGHAGRYAEETDPAVLADVITHDGTVTVRRALGGLAAWPALPDTATRNAGAALMLLNPQFEAPRSRRSGLAIIRAMGATLLRLGAEYRHTDFLPRYHDLNLRGGTQTDQHGRPIVGTLRKDGALLAAEIGSNRRFQGFDAVTAVDPTGYSDYTGVTASLERSVERGLALWASYTWSRTRDNWYGARDADPARRLLPPADSTGEDWADGRSDFDVPHRVALAAELRLTGSPSLRLGLIWRWRSGLPYTPGFRDGVDVNGDGVAGNDPAFVTDSLPGDTTGSAAAAVAANPCLRRMVGRIADRNACREPSAGSLSLRAALGLFRSGGRPVELLVDVFDLIAPDVAPVDRALYLVDRAAPLTTTGSVVTIPLVINPGFGRRIGSRALPVSLRAGLRMSL